MRISAAAAVGSAAGNITVATPGATTSNVAVSGTVTAPLVINAISIASAGVPTTTQTFDALGFTTIAGAFSSTLGQQTNLSTLTSSSTLNGWYAAKIGGNGTSPADLTADAGTGNSGALFSYGTTGGSDRALGALASGTNIMAFGALVKNDTASALTGLTFSFTTESWRNSTAVLNALQFGYGIVDGTTITGANFLSASTGVTLYSALDVNGPPLANPNGALDGNLPANRTIIATVTIPINIPAGQTAFFRWQDADDTGSDAGTAIDDLTLVGETSTVIVPTISLTSGTYLTNQTASISNFASYVSGETLRYTLDGTDPIATSTVYNNGTGIPILIGTGAKVLKVAAFPTAGGRSFISIGNYLLPLDVANLTVLRTYTAGPGIYRVTSPITFTGAYASRNTKFFQDGGAGIQIDDAGDIARPSPSAPYIVGDNVANVMGTLSSFNGQLQFVPKLAFGDPVSTGNAVTPVSRTIATLTDADQGRLVTITGVTFTSAGSAFPSPNYSSGTPGVTGISDGTTGTFQNLFGGAITGAPIPTGPNTVTGIVQKTLVGTTSTITVASRNLADIVFTGTAGLTITVAGNNITLNEAISLGAGPPYAGEAEVTITRSGDTTSALTVDLSVVASGQLKVDLDDTLGYRALPVTVTIAAGQAAKTIYLVPTNDAVYTGNRNATFTASAVGFTPVSQVFAITEDETPGNSYASWIAGFSVGTKTGPNDDFDGDGIANTLENYMGSNPSVSNTGLTAVSGTATSVTFRHNRADAPASDITASYQWSVDLVNWFPSGPGAGITVTIGTPTVITNGSPNDLVEVTASVTTGSATKLFARLKGVKAP
ncbi:MAG: chitobiase/beta-hexosaminidase C-terminal domain-containing protein [Luteolibacter sp.]